MHLTGQNFVLCSYVVKIRTCLAHMIKASYLMQFIITEKQLDQINP